MRRRSLITFVVLNVLISLAVIVAVINVFHLQVGGQAAPQVITVEVRVTSTQGPTATPLVVTATPGPGTPQTVQLPNGLILTPDLTLNPVSTIDPALINASVSLQGTATALPQNCVLHTIADGDTPFGIAEQYNVDGFELMQVNGLTEETAAALQIGDTLIVPLPGCSLIKASPTPAPTAEGSTSSTAEASASSAGSTGAEVTAEGTIRPTLTLPPTATNAKVSVLQVIKPGDVTAEGVEIENTGDTVDIAAWTLSDADGNTFTFPQQLLFSNARVTVYTRAGKNTPIAFYWGKDAPIWQTDDVVTLKDKNGSVQSTFRVPRAAS